MAHIPVLLNEVLEALALKPGDRVIDGTVDGGGHAAAILGCIGESGKLLGLDLDAEILESTRNKFSGKKNIVFLHANYAELPKIIESGKFEKADALLLDLGFSSEQLSSGRGFSFEKDEPLLMTFREEDEPVRDILRRIKEDTLADIIYRFGGERYSRRIAKAIKHAKRIETSKELAEVVRRALPGSYERGRIHPATRTFQALRIYANKELENVENVLAHLKEILKPGGRVAIISFHSLEDKLVKDRFREMKKEGTAELITKKPISATREEIRENPRSRSAKLRAAIIL